MTKASDTCDICEGSNPCCNVINEEPPFEDCPDRQGRNRGCGWPCCGFCSASSMMLLALNERKRAERDRDSVINSLAKTFLDRAATCWEHCHREEKAGHKENAEPWRERWRTYSWAAQEAMNSLPPWWLREIRHGQFRNEMQVDVQKFINHTQTPEIAKHPGSWPNQDMKKLCKTLIKQEVIEELLPAIDEDNWEEIIDGIGDSIFVLFFCACKIGIDLQPFWDAIVQANMKKFSGPIDPETKKQLKPEGWEPPDIGGILQRMKRKKDSL